MAKFENPVKGHLLCPVCKSNCTTHMCGEGQLIATGEPPKNSRNIGLFYYRCPECGNSPISKRISAFVQSEMAGDVTEPEALEAPSILVEGDDVKPEIVVDETEVLTELVQNESVTPNESKPPKRQDYSTHKRIAAALALLLVCAFIIKRFVLKQVDKGDEHVTA